jgi:diguanylate cyclase (GGDEF)-like protein
MAQLTPFTGQFRDPRKEHDFRVSILESIRHDTRWALFVGAALTAMFAISDYNFLGISPTFYKILAVRAVMIAGCIAMALMLYRSSAFLTRPWLHSIAPLVISVGTILILYFRPHSVGTVLTATALIVMAFYLFVPNLVSGMLFSSLFLSVGFTVASFAWAGFDAIAAITIGLLLAMANIVGYAVALRLARLNRQHFILLEDERLSQRRLAAEIEQRKVLETQLRFMAQTDALTNISNRRHFLEEAHEALAQARSQGLPFTICMIDIDRFKSVNDRWGHSGGDAVLRIIARTCREWLPRKCLIGRFGGEEFVLALPGHDLRAAQAVAEDLRRRIEALRFQEQMERLRTTATFGLAEVGPGEDGLDLAISRADAALYRGKSSGRNRVVPLPPAIAAQAG